MKMEMIRNNTVYSNTARFDGTARGANAARFFISQFWQV
jgi:hypothetical protein